MTKKHWGEALVLVALALAVILHLRESQHRKQRDQMKRLG